MRFDSAEFLFFFIIILTLHRLLSCRRALLTMASYLFYASWNPPFLLLLIASTLLDYTIGRKLEVTKSPGRRKALLGMSLAGNLGVLFYFKYVNFFLDAISRLGAASTGILDPFYVQSQIPLGISFYTFQTISYTVDVYRRQVRACRSFPDFALFVSFFPQLIAGPIIRAADFIPQIEKNKRADSRQILEGVELCLVGLFKKVVLADTYVQLVDRCFGSPEAYSGGGLLVAALAWPCYVYCDFSGYSTMGRGLGKFLGYHLPRNFRFPMLAGNPIEYRRRWHITMGNWFRDYLYRPLGGDRKGPWRTAFNTMLTWVAFGFWHGAEATFLVWGCYNGLLLVCYRLLRSKHLIPGSGAAATALGYLTMPIFMCIAYIFFRSTELKAAFFILSRILTWAPGVESVHPGWAAGLLSLYGIHWVNRFFYSEDLLSRVGWIPRFALIGGMLAVLYLFAGAGGPFFYFQF